MELQKKMCCLCLNVLNTSFTNLFSTSKDSFGNLSHFDKISTSLPQLATVLNTIDCSEYKVCQKCCDTIELVYTFNQTCLHNVKVFSFQHEFFKSKEQYNDLEQPGSSSKETNIVEEIEIKNEIEDETNLIAATHFDIEINENPIQNDISGKDLDENIQENTDRKDADLDVKEGENVDTHYNKDVRGSNLKKKEFICKVCNITACTSYVLKQHMRIHSGVKPYVCETCGKSFRLLSSLYTHKFVHSGERSHVCEICGKAFARKVTLYNHKFTHGGVRPISCNICNKRFIQNSDLIKHKRVHSGERPFQCEMCTQAFTNGSNLIKHRRIHTGDRPYVCESCGKTFSDQSHLIKHRKTHLEEKPYSCDTCDKTFYRLDHLRKHVSNQHK